MNGKYFPFIGFAPDLDPSTPGIFTATKGLYTTFAGFRPLPSLVGVGFGTNLLGNLPSTCRGCYVAVFGNGTVRIFAGTDTHLYEGLPGGWTEADSGQTFTGSGLRWSFAVFGNDLIATNGKDPVQVCSSTATGFSALAGNPPLGAYVEVTDQQVMLFGGTNNSFGANSWTASAAGNDALWDLNISDLSAGDVLTDTPGNIVAARKLGRNVLVYKNRGIYLGSFVGNPVVWRWDLVTPEFGTWGPGCVCNLGTLHAFVGLNGFYTTDGSGIYPILGPQGGKNPVQQWFFRNLNPKFAGNIESFFDEINQVVYWHFPSIYSLSGALDSWISWDMTQNRWLAELTSLSIDCTIQPFISTTISGLNLSTLRGVMDSTHTPKYFGGTPGGSSFTTGTYGDGMHYLFFTKLMPKFSAVGQPTCQVLHQIRYSAGDQPHEGDTGYYDTLNEGQIPLLGNAVYSSFVYTLSGDYEILGHAIDFKPDAEI